HIIGLIIRYFKCPTPHIRTVGGHFNMKKIFKNLDKNWISHGSDTQVVISGVLLKLYEGRSTELSMWKV
ncbi:MAG: hypothetical protein KAQ79_04025, partial [Cyclobacteriaceae bacterium]|nr:hypothetical protein [Cyclobacteriaceae bacterium]